MYHVSDDTIELLTVFYLHRVIPNTHPGGLLCCDCDDDSLSKCTTCCLIFELSFSFFNMFYVPVFCRLVLNNFTIFVFFITFPHFWPENEKMSFKANAPVVFRCFYFLTKISNNFTIFFFSQNHCVKLSPLPHIVASPFSPFLSRGGYA